MRRSRRRQSAGFALLFIFMMSAAIVVLLYREMPRVVFEGQRQKEQLAIERGAQYQRAIQLYIRKNKRYPSSLDDLDKTGEIRFLRRRYKDPLTGTDEWRLIHVNAAGQLTDSLVTPLPDAADEKKAPYDPFGQLAAQQAQEGVTPGMAPRGSDAPAAVAGQQLFGNGQGNPGDPNQQQGNEQAPASPFPPGYQTQYTGQPLPGQVVSVATTQPGAPPAPGQPPVPFIPGMPNQPTPGVQPGQVAVPGFAPGVQPGGAAPGTTPPGGQPNNAALNIIRNILTTPRPGGFPGATAQTNQQGGFGAGIAGVASQAEGEGIMVYNERSPYKEWEFVYDPTKDPNGALARGGPNQGGPGGPGGQNPGPGQTPGPGVGGQNGSRPMPGWFRVYVPQPWRRQADARAWSLTRSWRPAEPELR